MQRLPKENAQPESCFGKNQIWVVEEVHEREKKRVSNASKPYQTRRIGGKKAVEGESNARKDRSKLPVSTK